MQTQMQAKATKAQDAKSSEAAIWAWRKREPFTALLDFEITLWNIKQKLKAAMHTNNAVASGLLAQYNKLETKVAHYNCHPMMRKIANEDFDADDEKWPPRAELIAMFKKMQEKLRAYKSSQNNTVAAQVARKKHIDDKRDKKFARQSARRLAA